MPFMDPSGVRCCSWLGLDEAQFYNPEKIAIVPMGSCFPGLDEKGGDKPPRRECAERWRAELFAGLPNLDLILVIGSYAQTWHLGKLEGGLTGTVRRWRELLAEPVFPGCCPSPTPPAQQRCG